MRSLDVVDGDTNLFTVGPGGPLVLESAEANLGPLKVGENTDGLSGGVRRGADANVVFFVIGMLAVAEVEARHVHAALHELTDAVARSCRRSKCAYNFCPSVHGSSLVATPPHFYPAFATCTFCTYSIQLFSSRTAEMPLDEPEPEAPTRL